MNVEKIVKTTTSNQMVEFSICLFLPPPLFVEEVFAHRKKLNSLSYKWVDIIAITDSTAKRELFQDYFSQKSHERIFRTYFRFYISFRDWIYPSQTIPTMLKKLKEQYDALSLIEDWIEQGKLKITEVDDSPSLMYFLVTPDIFYEVLSNPGIGYRHNDNETVTLAKDHYTKASAKAFRMLQKS